MATATSNGGLAAVYARAMALQPVLKALTARGLRVNDALRKERIALLSTEAERLQEAAQDLLTPEAWDRLERPDLFYEEKVCTSCHNGKKKRLSCSLCKGQGRSYSVTFNLGSEQQLKDVLYNGFGLPERTQHGKATTDEEALQSLAALDHSGLIKLALRYGKLDTQRSIYERIAPGGDGHVRTVFNAAGTYTGRLAAAGAFYVHASTNLHNLSASEAARDPLFAVRDCIIPDEGEVFIYADLSQAEARVTACLSEDHALLEKWKDPTWDIHKWTASGVFSMPEDKITAEQRYLGKRVRHACVDALTEVLTPQGWEPIATLPDGRYVAQWSESGVISWCVPVIHKLKFDGELRVFEGQAFSQALTPDHRMPYITNRKLRVAQPDTLPPSVRLPLSGMFDGSTELSPPFVTLVAATQADGHYNKQGRIEFHFKKQRKITRLLSALIAVRAEWTKSKYKDGSTRIVIRDEQTNCIVRGWLSPTKTFDARLLNLQGSCLDVLLRELPHWDGGIYSYKSTKRRVVYFTSIYTNAVWAQTVAHLRGRQGLLRQKVDGMYEVSFNKRTQARVPRKQLKFHKGNVWCLTVDSSYFLVRRRDRISVTGNCNYGMGPNKFWRVINADADVTGIAITLTEAKRIHAAYHALHPNLDGVWWNRVERQITEHGWLETVFGRRCNFYPRLDFDSGQLDAETLRAAIAFEPQSTVADLKIVALLDAFQKEGGSFRVLHEAHDALLVGCKKAAVQGTALILKRCLEREIVVNNIKLTIPSEVFIGEADWSHLRRLC